jgi:hypothetical protein
MFLYRRIFIQSAFTTNLPEVPLRAPDGLAVLNI